MKSPASLFIFLFISSLPCNAKNKPVFTRQQDGVILTLKPTSPGDARFVRLKFITRKIIQVLATAADSFSMANSLMTIDHRRLSDNYNERHKHPVKKITAN